MSPTFSFKVSRREILAIATSTLGRHDQTLARGSSARATRGGSVARSVVVHERPCKGDEGLLRLR